MEKNYKDCIIGVAEMVLTMEKDSSIVFPEGYMIARKQGKIKRRGLGFPGKRQSKISGTTSPFR